MTAFLVNSLGLGLQKSMRIPLWYGLKLHAWYLILRNQSAEPQACCIWCRHVSRAHELHVRIHANKITLTCTNTWTKQCNSKIAINDLESNRYLWVTVMLFYGEIWWTEKQISMAYALCTHDYVKWLHYLRRQIMANARAPQRLSWNWARQAKLLEPDSSTSHSIAKHDCIAVTI